MGAEVKEVQIGEAITAVGKIFRGDYAKTQEYILEVKKELRERNIAVLPGKVMGVYYDNPQHTPADELASFQGVFLEDESADTGFLLHRLSLKGRYLFTKVSGDPTTSIMEGYSALFAYIRQHGAKPEMPAGFQISTMENGVISTEIYMKLKD